MNQWPSQKDCNEFYGNPRGLGGEPNVKWESANLIRLKPAYKLYYAGQPVSSIRVHKKCAEAMAEAFETIRKETGGDEKLLTASGANVFAGAYNFRLMRGGTSLSMHSWGCAIDLDPARNGMGDTTPNFDNHLFIVKAFEDVGAVWGGRWKGRFCDGMHFQFATV